MMDILWSFFGFIIAIGILVTFHEFGHFWVARRLGVKVVRFSIGFGKPLWKHTSKAGTEYVIAMIPLGGYVKMLDETTEENINPADLQFAFNQKSVWRRMLIVLAGPAFNFIFAIFAYWLIFSIGMTVVAPILGEMQSQSIAAKSGLQNGDEILTVDGQSVNDWHDVNFALVSKIGETGTVLITYKSLKSNDIYSATLNLSDWKVDQKKPDLLGSLGFNPYYPDIPAVLAKVIPDSAAAKAGLQPQDTILKIANQPIKNWEQMVPVLNHHVNKPTQIEVLRNGKLISLTLTPEAVKNADGLISAKIGVQSGFVKWPENLLRTVRYPFFKAGAEAVKSTWNITSLSFQMLYKMITGKISARSISGPIGIAEGAGYSAQLGFNVYLTFLALISISLGVINLLPVPMLDGGHFLYYVIELLRGKPLSLKTQMLGMRLGLLLLFSLMLLAVFNDVSRLFS